jgi:hypothetical protein
MYIQHSIEHRVTNYEIKDQRGRADFNERSRQHNTKPPVMHQAHKGAYSVSIYILLCL